MPESFVRRRFNPLWIRIGEIFSAAQTGLQGGPPGFTGGGDDGAPGGEFPVIHGIQTEQGIDITTEGGDIIQAENQ